MLATLRRLRAHEVREVLKKGASRRSTYLSMKYVASKTSLRSAAVVSKKTAKKATERNRLRRALYRALASRSEEGQAVLLVQKVPKDAPTEAFRADLGVLFRD